MKSAFIEFCEYICTTSKDLEDFSPDSIAYFFVNFIEPFAAENDIELPESLNSFIETLFDASEETCDDEADYTEETNDDETEGTSDDEDA